MKLKIPPKIVIGGVESDIKITSMSDHGSFHTQTQLIELSNELKGDFKSETFLHEILEAINYRYELKLKHRQITALSAALWQVLKQI